MIASILQASGKNIGLYTSPHLIRFNERIRINGYPIPDKKIINFMKKQQQLKFLIKQMEKLMDLPVLLELAGLLPVSVLVLNQNIKILK